MNINNWLCKHFDHPTGKYDDSTVDKPHPIEPKGYVTISDILFSRYMFWFVVILYTFLLGGIFFGVLQNSFHEDPKSSMELIIALVYAWVLPIKIVVSVVIILIILYMVSQIQIAKCPLKEKEKK